MEFSYFMPVRLLFGANVIDQLGATAKSYGTHALIVTGRSSTKRSGLLDRSIALLEAAGVRATVFNKVEPNPLTTTVMEGAALAREQGCDLVIGMGGGSMMDAAKAVAFCAVNGGDVNDYLRWKAGYRLPAHSGGTHHLRHRERGQPLCGADQPRDQGQEVPVGRPDLS